MTTEHSNPMVIHFLESDIWFTYFFLFVPRSSVGCITKRKKTAKAPTNHRLLSLHPSLYMATWYKMKSLLLGKWLYCLL